MCCGWQARSEASANSWHHKLVLGRWNVISPAGKEPEPVCEVAQYQLDIVVVTSTHIVGSRTIFLERGWTLSYSGVAQRERLKCQMINSS